jgi:DNA-binding winged helix-turn-helix (wHTH) protein
VIYSFGECLLDTCRRELRHKGEFQSLEPQVFDLIAYLVEHHERVVSRDEMLQAIGAGQFVSDGLLSTRLSSARRAIGDDGRDQRLIRTFRRRGLRFVGAVTKVTEPIEPAKFTIPEKADVPAPAPAAHPRNAGHVLAAFGAILMSDAMEFEQLAQEISSAIIVGLSALI